MTPNHTIYRHLTPDETAQLERQGNWAADWSAVVVADPFDAACLRGNTFEGCVRLGSVAGGSAAGGDLPLRRGIYRSTLRDCTVGCRPTIHDVRMLAGYSVGDDVTLFDVGEMTCSDDPASAAWLEAMNENGGRRLLPCAGMTVGDAYLWARYRGRPRLMERLEAFTRSALATDEGRYGQVGDSAVVRHVGSLHNVAVGSRADDPTRLTGCLALADGVVGTGCTIGAGVIAERFLLGEHVHLDFGLRMNDTVVGDNSTLARCEVAASIVFPAHEQHHNNSFLIAALVMGQSNVAAGATLGSNHNSRAADGELAAGRGFWPGLCCSAKHSSRFASHCLMAKGDYPAELDITLPFALVGNNVAAGRLEVMPAYWWMYNMYALDRNSHKFAARDRRVVKAQHIVSDTLAPDTAEEILAGMELLRGWIADAKDGVVYADGMENSKRPTVVLKAAEGLEAYGEMLVFYAMDRLTAAYGDALPPSLPKEEREWMNIGGQLVGRADMEQLITDVESGAIGSWQQLHGRMDALWQAYPDRVREHAYGVLCRLAGTDRIDKQLWEHYLRQYSVIRQTVEERKQTSRSKDDENPFRRATYSDDDERRAVTGRR